ncbi:MAG TPA: fluoride efflux transporter CrcB [Micromonosporaceae bacterium]|nr:fluoride efflux transporter CrcB [Micromonosporaceae bacterium]
MTVLLVVVGAIVGAPMRYLTDRAVQARHDSVFPWGTLAVNVAGSFILGLLVAGAATHGVSPHVVALVGTGFCGALTTYSTFSYETVRLAQEGARFYAVANVVASVVAGLGAAFFGAAVAQAIWG